VKNHSLQNLHCHTLCQFFLKKNLIIECAVCHVTQGLHLFRLPACSCVPRTSNTSHIGGNASSQNSNIFLPLILLSFSRAQQQIVIISVIFCQNLLPKYVCINYKPGGGLLHFHVLSVRVNFFDKISIWNQINYLLLVSKKRLQECT
jgi:hypothetical protein